MSKASKAADAAAAAEPKEDTLTGAEYLLTTGTFASLSPSATVPNATNFSNQGFGTGGVFEEAQNKKNEAFWAGLQADNGKINYAATDENGNPIPLGNLTPENQTAVNFQVTNDRTLGTTVLNPALTPDGSSSAYNTLMAADESESENTSKR